LRNNRAVVLLIRPAARREHLPGAEERRTLEA
jgi:hypothetical protein